MKLYEKTNYLADVGFLISTFIREYDISKANINILYKYKVIDENKYNELLNADRMTRQVQIGLMQKDKQINNILRNGIEQARKDFFLANNLKDNDILAIKNDAIFVINKLPKYTKFDNIEFICKNIYTSYYKLLNLELYYFYDAVRGFEKLDVKGISEENLKKHESYFLEFLKVSFNSAQIENIRDTLDIVITFNNKYINLDLDIGYYRQFDYESVYLLKQISKYNIYKSDNISESNKKNIDIKYNLELIRILYQIYSSIQLKMF